MNPPFSFFPAAVVWMSVSPLKSLGWKPKPHELVYKVRLWKVKRSRGRSPPEGLRVLPKGPLPSFEDSVGRCKLTSDAKSAGAWIWTHEPPEVWEIHACVISRPVHGSFAVIAGRDEDPDFPSHDCSAPWLTLSCSSRRPSSQHCLSVHPCNLSPLQSVSGWSQGCSPTTTLGHSTCWKHRNMGSQVSNSLSQNGIEELTLSKLFRQLQCAPKFGNHSSSCIHLRASVGCFVFI